MTRTRWFRPVLGLVLALAVGATAALVAMRFAPPEQIAAEPVQVETTFAPVLEPVDDAAEGDEAVPDPAPVDGAYPISDPVGTGTVVVPPEDDDLGDREAEALTESEAESDDPPVFPVYSDLLAALRLPIGPLLAGAGGDPCAPAEGEPAAGSDCPEGTRSVVLPLVAEEIPFMVWVLPNPPTPETISAGYDPAGGRSCESVVDDRSRMVMIAASRPAQVQYSLLKVDDATDLTDAVIGGDMVRTSDEQRRAWEASLEGADSIFDVAFPFWCVRFDDLEDGRYFVYPLATSDDGVAPANEGTSEDFVVPNPDDRPDILIRTVGDNLVLATAVHAADERVDLRAYVSPDGGWVYNCPAEGDGVLEEISRSEGGTSAAFRAGIAAGPTLTEKVVESYRVPEGSRILFCAIWYPDGEEPSWDRNRAVHYSSRSVQSPDRILPVVTVRTVTAAEDSNLRNVRILGSSIEGSGCGRSVPWARGADFTERVLCDGEAFSDEGVRGGDGYLRSVGFSGDLALRVLSTYDDDGGDTEVENWAFLRLADRMCVGECRLPSSRHYFVPIGSPGGDSACGVFSGLDCRPATTDRIGGTVMVKVSWTQGSQNGLETWDVSTPMNREVPFEEYPYLAFDRTATWQLGALDRETLTYSASLDVRFNQPIGYEVVLIPRGDRIPETCGQVGSGWSDFPAGLAARVTLSGLCPGVDYRTVVRSGPSATEVTWWEDGGGRWWPDGTLDVPQIPVRLIWAVGVEGDPGDKVRQLDILLDDQHLSIPEMRCVSGDGTYYADGDIETTLTNQVRLGGRIDIRKQPPCVDLEPRQAGPTDLWASGTVFPLADLLSDGGIEYRITANGDTLVLRVKAFLR